MKKAITLFLLIGLVSFLGCTTTQKGAGVGAVAGGGLGAIIGHQSGHTTEGALIGAGAGAVAGALIGEQMDTKFCPVCGNRFPSSVEFCPNDGTKLQPIEK